MAKNNLKRNDKPLHTYGFCTLAHTHSDLNQSAAWAKTHYHAITSLVRAMVSLILPAIALQIVSLPADKRSSMVEYVKLIPED